MKTYIKKYVLSENSFSEIIDNKEYVWQIPTLIQYCKEQNYKSFQLPLIGIYTGVNVWKLDSVKSTIETVNRINNANFDHPILLDDTGFICDGWHRVVKAITLGHDYIEAIRIEEMPPVSKIIDL